MLEDQNELCPVDKTSRPADWHKICHLERVGAQMGPAVQDGKASMLLLIIAEPPVEFAETTCSCWRHAPQSELSLLTEELQQFHMQYPPVNIRVCLKIGYIPNEIAI